MDHRSSSDTALPIAATFWYERGYVAALKPKYRLVLIDARGHGQSDKPHDPPSYTPEKFASDIVAVLDDLGMKTATYWGYSMGGRMGFALARHALDRVACFVIGGATASGASAYSTEPGKEDPMITALRAGPNEIIKLWGEEVTPPLRERLLANDMAALIACRQQPPTTEDFPTCWAQLPCRRFFMPEVLIRSTIQHGKVLPRYPAHNSCRYRV